VDIKLRYFSIIYYDLIVYIGKKMNMLEIKAEVSHCSERDWHLN